VKDSPLRLETNRAGQRVAPLTQIWNKKENRGHPPWRVPPIFGLKARGYDKSIWALLRRPPKRRRDDTGGGPNSCSGEHWWPKEVR